MINFNKIFQKTITLSFPNPLWWIVASIIYPWRRIRRIYRRYFPLLPTVRYCEVCGKDTGGSLWGRCSQYIDEPIVDGLLNISISSAVAKSGGYPTLGRKLFDTQSLSFGAETKFPRDPKAEPEEEHPHQPEKRPLPYTDQ